jgi:hypothetical protein
VGQYNLTQDRDKRQAAHSKETLVVRGFDECAPVTSAIRGRPYVLVVMDNFIINCCSPVLIVREG